MSIDKRQEIHKYYSLILDVTKKDYNPAILKEYIDRMTGEEVENSYHKLVFSGIMKFPFLLMGPMGIAATLPITVIEIANTTETILKCIGSYDYSDKTVTEINGNQFTYDKDFPIDEYREELYRIGNDIKDEIFTVYIQDGELVVY
ncbi:MAG: hypothetical protein J6O73_13780 [Lachnospiraceae bacterium]|nr:hypothetical protein [Lachnospiraceae bacterium]